MGRKIVCICMALVLVLGLAACADTGADDRGDELVSLPGYSQPVESDEPTTTTTTTKKPTTTTTKKSTTTTTKKSTTTTTKKSTKKSTTTKKPTTTTTKKPTTTTTKKPTTTTTTRRSTTTTVTTQKPTTTTTTNTTITPQPTVYGAGQTWRVPGQFEFTINAVQEHYVCRSNYKDYGSTAVIVDYTWKNLGYDTTLRFEEYDIQVYDQKGQANPAKMFYCDHKKNATSVLAGGTGSGQIASVLYNDGNSYVTILVEKGDYSATFRIPVTEAPPEPEEDKLEGCTFTVENSLPETFSYYKSYGEKYTSSCSVTEVTFEVSGDDLYMYFSGRKTYDSRGSGQSDSCKISWKLYDDDTNTVIATGTADTLSLAEGEGFVKTKDYAYDCITPGGNYRLLLLNTN